MIPRPLAEKMRPQELDEIVGQDHLLGKSSFLRSTIKRKKPVSLILWGPPGSGKSSIAHIYAKAFPIKSESISAIFNGVADLKKILKETKEDEPILLFVDEIHRFNKAQQDAFLPFLESGKLILIGTTVENPSFYLNKALLSRVRVLCLNGLEKSDLEKIFDRYEKIHGPLEILTKETKETLIHLSHGDARYLLNLVENLEKIKAPLSQEELEQFLQEKAPLFDKDTDQHYNLISALHKSVRGSDPDAALYWFSRMVIGGEDPLFIARRLIRMSVEDIGLADPQALVIAVAARDSFQMLGSPEGELALANVVIYLSLAPKSNASYEAYNASMASAEETNHLLPPMIIMNAPTPMMKQMGYGKGYIYDHSLKSGFSGQNYFPEGFKREDFYHPTDRGYEQQLGLKLADLKKQREDLW